MIRKPKRNNPRDNDAYKHFRQEVIKRDKGKCQMPNCSKRGTQVHHIIRYADSSHGRLIASNAVLLCRVCHQKVTGNESIYAPLFVRIVGENNAKNKK